MGLCRNARPESLLSLSLLTQHTGPAEESGLHCSIHLKSRYQDFPTLSLVVDVQMECKTAIAVWLKRETQERS